MGTGRRIIGAMATLVVTLGVAATPAHAAPATPSGSAPVVATPVPAGSAPVAGPTYHFTDEARAAGDMSVLADSLPFNYTFEYEASLESRRFKTTTSQVCNTTQVYSTQDIKIELWVDTFGWDVQQGATVVYAAGENSYYCWSGVNSNNTYYLKFLNGWAEGKGSVAASH